MRQENMGRESPRRAESMDHSIIPSRYYCRFAEIMPVLHVNSDELGISNRQAGLGYFPAAEVANDLLDEHVYKDLDIVTVGWLSGFPNIELPLRTYPPMQVLLARPLSEMERHGLSGCGCLSWGGVSSLTFAFG